MPSDEPIDITVAVTDLLCEASWNERLPGLVASGDPDVLEYVAEAGMPTRTPQELLAEAIRIIHAEMDAVNARLSKKKVCCTDDRC